MIEHVPGCVEGGLDVPAATGPSLSPSMVGLLEQIRKDIDSQTLELKRCITLSSLSRDPEDLPAWSPTMSANSSFKRQISTKTSIVDGCQQSADEVDSQPTRQISFNKRIPRPHAPWAQNQGHAAADSATAGSSPSRTSSKRSGEHDLSGSAVVHSEVIQVRNTLLRNAGLAAASKHVAFEQQEDGGGSGVDRREDAEKANSKSEEPDIKRSDPNTFGTHTGNKSRDGEPHRDQSLNNLAQKAWSHLSTPSKWSKQRKGMKTALRAVDSDQDLEGDWAVWVTNHSYYELCSAFLILCNAMTIALETQSRCRRALEPDPSTVLGDELHWIVLRDLFCWLFFMELALRIAAQRRDFFFSGEWEWNVFDCVVVLSAFVEMFASHARGNQSSDEGNASGFEDIIAHSSLLRILRLLRIVRVLRVVSVSRTIGNLLCFQDLRTMVSALCGALKSLLWVVVTMLLIVLIFAIYFTEGAIDRFHQGAHDEGLDNETLRAKYGGLPTAMLSLLKAITGGEDWGDTLEPLEDLPVTYPFVFTVYVLFGTLALMNIVTAVFVDSTVQRSRKDQSYVIQQESFAKKEFIQTMCFIFEELDGDGSGEISLDELKKFIESSTIVTYFSALDINITEVRSLFSLIDIDHSGFIDRDEFIWGCLRLKGGAKSLDLALLQYDVKMMQQSLQEIYDTIIPEDAQQLHSDGHGSEAISAMDAILAA